MKQQWETLLQAADRLGYDVGHLRRYCDAWAKAGKAKFVRGGGRRSHWMIDRTATCKGAVPESPRDRLTAKIGIGNTAGNHALPVRLLGWSTVARTAHRLGYSARRVRLQCPAWARIGKAKFVNGGGIRSRWLIDPTATLNGQLSSDATGSVPISGSGGVNEDEFASRARLMLGWLTPAQTAHRLGIPIAHVRRSCPEWEKRGSAKLVKHRGRPRWQIHPTVRRLPEPIQKIEADVAAQSSSGLICFWIPPGSEDAARSILNALSKGVRE